jgi:hypothetical protein
MVDLVILISMAKVAAARVMDGIIKFTQLSDPIAGNKSNFSANSSISINPSQNPGIEVNKVMKKT